MRHESPENGRYGDETPDPALGDPRAENGPQMPAQVSAFLDAKVREDLDAWLGRVEW